MNAFANHFAFEFKAGIRNATAMLLNYLFPLMFYAAMGAVMVGINPDFAEVLMPAMVVFTVMAATILGLPPQLVEARDAGIYRSFKINGVPPISILSIPAVSTIVHALVASAFIAATAGPLFGALTPVSWGAFAGLAVLTAFSFGAMAALIGVISTGTRDTVLWSQLVFLPSMLIGGLMIGLDVLPEGIRPFSGLLPSAYAMEAMRGLAFDLETVLDPTVSLLVLAATGIVSFALAVVLFSWDRQNSGRRAHPLLALLAVVPLAVGMALA